LDKAPEKIISLSPGITEMIFLLHAESKLIGISDYCNFPEETRYINKVGGLQNMNIEKIISMQPDVVLIGSIIPKNEVDKLENAGIKVIAIKQEEKLAGMLEALRMLGRITDNEVLGDSLVGCFSAKLEGFYSTEGTEEDTELHRLIPLQFIEGVPEGRGSKVPEGRGSKPTVYYVVSFGTAGDFTAPKNSHISEIITLAGGKNIGDTLTSWNISREYLFSQNPDLIFVRTEDLEHFVKTYP
jgi:iron complex transport system substrate-binding protein